MVDIEQPATSYHDWKSKPQNPPYGPIRLELSSRCQDVPGIPGSPGHITGRTKSIKENDSKLTNEDGKVSTSSCMNFDKIIFIIMYIQCIYIYMRIYIYIYKAFMYGKLKENSDTNFWFVLICVLPSSLLYGVPPHQIPLKPPNLQLFTPHLHFFQCQGPIQCFQGTLPRSYIVKNHGFQHYAVKW